MSIAVPESAIILACGIPGSGKSTYACWLKREKGFVHFNFDKPAPEHLELKAILVDCISKGLVAPFMEGVHRIGRLVAIDWGFKPIPEIFSCIRALQHDGVEVWLFDGDREAARQSFIRRGTVAVEALNRQMDLIEKNWAEIQAIVGSRVIYAIHPDGKYTPPEEIFQRMFG